MEYNTKREKYHNAKYKVKIYKIEDKIWLLSQNIYTICLAKKLDYKYYRPFIISRCVGIQAYQLNLPKLLVNINDVFYVSLLKLYHTIESWALALSPLIKVDGKDQAEIEEVVDNCVHYGKLQYLIKWLGYMVTDNEWAPTNDLGFAKKYVGEFHLKYPSKPLPEYMH